VSSRNELINNSISLNGKAVVLRNSDDNLIGDNDIGKCGEGISVENSRRNSILNNTLYSDGAYGLVLRGSSNNTVSSNTVSNNTAGIRLEEASSENVVYDNDVSSNGNGMYVQESSSNDLIRNNVSANDVGILLVNSGNSTIAENSLLGNNVGLFLNVSNGNLAYSNVLTENIDALELLKSNNNTLQLNVISLNRGIGVNVSFSNFNIFLHNGFFNNTLRPVSANSSNIWDNGVEGNFWGYEGAADEDRNGIADTPFVIGGGDRDNFPLMAEYLQLVAVMDNVQYPVGIVCNSSISNFRYFRDPTNATSLISFRVNPFEGLGFCRIAIPRALIQPPFDITVDNVPPLYQKIAASNQTHVWLYFSFPIGGNVRIASAAPAPPFWTEYWFWGVIALALVVSVLALALSLFYRRLGSYKRTIEEVEKKLKEKEQSPLGVARRLFGADVERRSAKIGKFEEKYGVKIRPRESLDDIFKGLEKKEKERKQKDEVNS
jgi:parallel beta-helix repeat protein